nr:helix-turn-helix domain-containing protein [Klebsiella pneumoniae subsp. pneumoniae]
MSTEQWVTAEHVAEHLGIAKDTVYRWREHKGLPASCGAVVEVSVVRSRRVGACRRRW